MLVLSPPSESSSTLHDVWRIRALARLMPSIRQLHGPHQQYDTTGAPASSAIESGCQLSGAVLTWSSTIARCVMRYFDLHATLQHSARGTALCSGCCAAPACAKPARALVGKILRIYRYTPCDALFLHIQVALAGRLHTWLHMLRCIVLQRVETVSLHGKCFTA